MLEPDGRVVMVSGANRGIGLAVAERLFKAGYILSLGARDPSGLSGVPAGAEEAGSRVLRHVYEASSRESAVEWVRATRERFGRIDGLVNVAGVIKLFDVESGEEADLDEMWEVNAKGPWRLVNAAFDALKQSGTGRVVTIVSLSGKRVKSAEAGGYSMSKFAALALSHATRFSGWEHGIRTTAICPGFVRTDMTSAVDVVAPDEMIQPEEIAELTATALALPNTASVSEIPVACVLDHTY